MDHDNEHARKVINSLFVAAALPTLSPRNYALRLWLETTLLSGNENLRSLNVSFRKDGRCTKCRTLSPELQVHIKTPVLGLSKKAFWLRLGKDFDFSFQLMANGKNGKMDTAFQDCTY